MLCLFGFKSLKLFVVFKVIAWCPMVIHGFSATTAESGGNVGRMRMVSQIYVMLILKYCAFPAWFEDNRHMFASTAPYFQCFLSR